MSEGGWGRARGGSPAAPTPLTLSPHRDLEEDPYFTDGFPDSFGTTKNPPPASTPSGKGQVSEVVSR